jgi:DNA-binding XRE family transcriptional regulator
MHIETITREGKKLALLPLKELKKLLADAEMLADIQAYDAVKANIRNGHDEIIPFEITERRLARESPVKIWREYRGITQNALATDSGVTRTMIAAIESGHKTGSVATLKKLACALDVSLDQIS